MTVRKLIYGGPWWNRQIVGYGSILKCGCVLGCERCIDCRPGLHADQTMALAITLGDGESARDAKEE